MAGCRQGNEADQDCQSGIRQGDGDDGSLTVDLGGIPPESEILQNTQCRQHIGPNHPQPGTKDQDRHGIQQFAALRAQFNQILCRFLDRAGFFIAGELLLFLIRLFLRAEVQGLLQGKPSAGLDQPSLDELMADGKPKGHPNTVDDAS